MGNDNKIGSKLLVGKGCLTSFPCYAHLKNVRIVIV
jgi:hypothetical protein